MESIETLNFFISGFSGGYERIICQNNKINYQFFEHSYFEDEEATPDKALNVTALSTKDWEEFW